MGSERRVKLRKQRISRSRANSVETQDETAPSLSAKQVETLRLQQLVGNRAAQRMMLQRSPAADRDELERRPERVAQAAAHTPEIQRSELLDNAISWIKKKLGVTENEAQLAKDLAESLEKAKKICEKGAGIIPDEAAKTRLSQAAGMFGDVAEKLDTVVKYREYASEIVDFVDAVNRVNKVDIEKNPMEAADAFGALFASTGKLGKHMEGPWSAYFELLEQSRHFFSNVERGLIPSERENVKALQNDPDVGPLLR